MLFLAIDTETTGLVHWQLPVSDPTQPHLAEVAAVLFDGPSGREVARLDTLIRPDGWEMPPEAGAVNGITTELCRREGLPLFEVTGALSSLLLCAHGIVAHHWDFEHAILSSAWHRARMGGSGAFTAICSQRGIFDTTRHGAARFPDLPLASHGKGPRQSDLHERLFGCRPEKAHRAMPDCQTLIRNFYALSFQPWLFQSANAGPGAAAPVPSGSAIIAGERLPAAPVSLFHP